MKNILLFTTSLLMVSTLMAQNTPNPFAPLGEKESRIVTLTQGKFDEFHLKKDFVKIGSAVIDTKNETLAYFIEKDDTLHSKAIKELEPDVTSRWLSPDPLQKVYPDVSPYAAFGNNPIYFTDPDGKIIRPVNPNADEAFNQLLHTIGNDKQLGKLLQIDVDEKSHAYYSYDQNAISFKSFSNRAKNNDIKLGKEDLKKAYTVYLAVQSKETIEINVLQSQQSSSTIDPGTQGTTVVKNLLGFENKTRNEALSKASPQEGETYTGTTVSNILNSTGADKKGKGWAFFKNTSDPASGAKNSGLKGQIVIDATNQSKSETGNAAYDAIKNVTGEGSDEK